MPVISYPDAPMWVRTLNQFNDSPHARNSKAELLPLTPEQEGEFIARFAIDQDSGPAGSLGGLKRFFPKQCEQACRYDLKRHPTW